MSKRAWEDLSDPGYSTGYQTVGKKCATKGCENDAGTFWFDNLCPICTRKKLRDRNKETKHYRARVQSSL